MMGDRMSMEKLTRQVRDLLSALRISTSRNYDNRHQLKAVVDDLKKGIDIDPHDLVLVNFDNVGFKEIADIIGRIGYQQFTAFQIIIIKRIILEKCGVYAVDAEDRLSREPSKDWVLLCKEDKGSGKLAEQIVKIKPEDVTSMSHSALENIKIAVAHALLRGFEKGQTMINTAKIIDVNTHAQLLADTPLSNMDWSSVEALVTADDASGNGIIVSEQTMVRMAAPVEDGGVCNTRYGDNVSLNIVKQDLSKNRTVKAMGDLVFALREKQLKEWKASAEFDEQAEPPIAEIGGFAMCDGKPANQMRNQIVADLNRPEPKWNGYVHVINGGFHLLLKVYTAMGDLFANLFPSLIVDYRKTIQRQQYIGEKLHDPRQYEIEYPQILNFIYGSAGIYTAQKLGRNPTAAEVDDHMIERAKKYPIAMLVLLYTRFAELTKLMRASERLGERGCVALYLQCLRFALPLFAMTHKTDYVRLVTDFLVEWECASEAFKVVFSKFLYTQLTSTGFPVWSDLFMELSILDIRRHTGKVARRGLETKLEYVANQIPKRQKTGNVIESLRNGKQQQKTTRSRTHLVITDPITVFNRVHNTFQIFHHSEHPIIGRDKEGKPIYAEEGSFALPNGEVFVPEQADVIGGGTRRGLDFIQVNNINEQNKLNRSEDDVPLTKVTTKAEDRKAQLDRAILIKTSVDQAALASLNKHFIKDDIVREINSTESTMQLYYDIDITPSNASKDSKRDELISTLVSVRKQLFAHDKTLKERLTDEVTAAYQGQYSLLTTEERCELLSTGVFALDKDVKNLPRYSTPLNDT
jgi:hypothetical protein